MEDFSWWWIIWGCFELFMGICVGVIMLIAMNRKGGIALFMLPLVLWQVLWASWQSLRSAWLWEWLMNNDFSREWYSTSFLVGSIFTWMLVFLALIPAMVKDKPKPESSPKAKPSPAAATATDTDTYTSPGDAYANLSEE